MTDEKTSKDNPTPKPSLLRRVRLRLGIFYDIGWVLLAFLAIQLFQMRNMLAADELTAPPLDLATLSGEFHSQAANNRPTLVYFFAPWCGICGASAHNINSLREGNSAEDLSVVMVALDWQQAEEVREFASRHALQVPVLMGERETADNWRVPGYPTYYVLDSANRIVHKDFGYTTRLGLWWRTRGVD